MTWWHYLLLCNLYLILFFGFYALLLRRETFFQLNRVYLVGSSLLSFIIPIIQSEWVRQWFITQKVQQTIYSASPAVVIYQFKPVQNHQVTLGQIMTWVYIAGIVILGIKLLWQMLLLSRVLKQGKGITAWSFFKKINVDEQLPGREIIIAHEEVHARQWHSADVLMVETIMILNWFNPIVYLYRNAIKHIHEFIADQDAVKAGTSKADYAMLLLSQTFDAPVHKLLNPFFSQSVLKQRIIMLQKNKSHYSALIKYGFSAPLFALMLALSSATINNSSIMKTVHTEAAQVLAKPAAPLVLESIKLQPPADTLTAQTTQPYAATPQEVAAKATNEYVDEPAVINEPAIVTPQTDAATTEDDKHNEVFSAVEVTPEFPGGIDNFYRFLAKNIRYPAEARNNNVQGRVIVTFVIEKDGSLSDVKVLRSPGAGLGEEAVRAVAVSPKWNPGRQNGRTVRVQYTVPVVFTLQGDEPKHIPDTTKRISHISVTKLNFTTTIKGTGKSSPDTALLHAARNVVEKEGYKLQKLYVMTNDKAQLHTPLFIVDGKEVRGNAVSNIPANKILSIAVWKHRDAAISKDNPALDSVVITTKK